jgi:hypothetical protein
MSALIVRLPEEKRERLKLLAKARHVCQHDETD